MPVASLASALIERLTRFRTTKPHFSHRRRTPRNRQNRFQSPAREIYISPGFNTLLFSPSFTPNSAFYNHDGETSELPLGLLRKIWFFFAPPNSRPSKPFQLCYDAQFGGSPAAVILPRPVKRS
jgi:hypothetical protein